jgi:NAD-dependent SIR2 family protein deacetylase
MKHVYVFGAGASTASANTPLGRDLVWNYHLDCGLMVPIKSGVPDLSEENENFTNLRKFLELCSSIYPEFKNLPKEWDGRGEEIFHLYDRIEKKHYVDELLEILYRDGNKSDIELVRKLIFEHLVESSIGSQNLLYKKFIAEILKKDSQQQASIISFNFDFLLHEDFKNDVYFDYLLKFDWIDTHRQRIYARTNPIKLIKLNGSLDWGICPSCNRLYLYFHHMFRNSYDNKKCSECGEHIQPFVIIPHERYGTIIKPLWSIAEKVLKRANIVTVIGYSFPEYDQKVVDLFSMSLGSNTKLQLVTRCGREENEDRKKSDMLIKYKRLFPTLMVEPEIYLNGFEGYIDTHTK